MSQDTVMASTEAKIDSERGISDTVKRLILLAALHWKLIALTTIAGFSCALLYVIFASKLYTASAVIMVDPRRTQAAQAKFEDLYIDATSIASQVEVIKSDKIINSVVEDLDLLEDPEFTGSASTPFEAILGTLNKALSSLSSTGSEDDESSPEKIRQQVLAAFKDKLAVIRIGSTYVFEIRYTSRSPEKAARISNAVASAYVADAFQSRIEAARQTAELLHDRLREMSAQVESSELAVASFKARSNITDQERVKLRHLESTAQANRALFESFLQRLRQVQEAFPISELRVITEASPPLQKSSPNSRLLLALGAIGGMAAGALGAFMREQLGGGILSKGDLEQITGIQCLGIVQKVKSPAISRNHPASEPEGKSIDTRQSILRYVVHNPRSRFAEVVRSIKVSMDLAHGMRPGKVTGIISALPREGKTTMSVNLGQLMASSGASVLLIDADLRNPTLSRNLAASADSGLLDVISGQERLEDAIWSDPTTGLGLLPAGRSAGVINTSEVLASTAMQTFLDRLRGEYDYILVDLPPVCAAVDVKAVSPFIDMFVMVIKWGETSPDAVLEALASIPNPQKIVGSVLAGANPSLLSRLEGYKGRHYAGYFSA